MRKNLLSFIILITVLFVVGCGGGGGEIVKQDLILLKIYRCKDFDFDPYLVLLAKEIIIDERIITIKGLINLTSNNVAIGYEWVVPKMDIMDGNLVINLANYNTAYHIYSGKKHYYFPIVK